MRSLLSKEELEIVEKTKDPNAQPPKPWATVRSMLIIGLIFILFVLFGCIIASVR